MTPYVTMTDVTGKIPGPFLTQALDDIGDGSAVAATWSQVAQDVADEIDGLLGARYTVPFSNPLPPVVVRAAKILACEAIYQRRGKTDVKNNPFMTDAAKVREQLAAIAAGEAPLDPSKNRQEPSVSVISAPAKTTSATGATAV